MVRCIILGVRSSVYMYACLTKRSINLDVRSFTFGGSSKMLASCFMLEIISVMLDVRSTRRKGRRSLQGLFHTR